MARNITRKRMVELLEMAELIGSGRNIPAMSDAELVELYERRFGRNVGITKEKERQK